MDDFDGTDYEKGEDPYTVEETRDDVEGEGEDDEETSPTETEGVQRIRTGGRTFTVLRGEERKTNRLMTKYEYARLVSAFAELLSNGLPCHQDALPVIRAKKLYDPLDLAEIHLGTKTIPIPINIERPLPSGFIEIWDPREMIFPSEVLDLDPTTL